VSAGLSDRKIFFKKTALIGAGLIGGSIALALRERRLVDTISCYDLDPQTRDEAVERGVADFVAASASEAVYNADLIILAVPVLKTLTIIKEILPKISIGALLTDVGSTKGAIMAAVEQLLPPGVFYIGGHPMAGSEESGIRGADPALLENAIYVLTPASGTPVRLLAAMTEMLQEAGAQPITVDPLNHDRVVAMVSHLPHLSAAALVRSATMAGDKELMQTLAAGGFRDSTRIALGNPEVWSDIFISNRWALLAALKEFRKNIDLLEGYLSDYNSDAVYDYLWQAREYRSTIPHRGRGILPELFELVVLVRDTPGVLGRLTGLLGEAKINIDAIEILHVRELVGGSIRIGFRDKENRQKALAVLKRNGYSIHLTE
jgi:prephenate dehydrogenase